MEEILNFIDFALEESTIRQDLDGNTSIDANRIKEILVEYITRRELKLKREVVKEAKEALTQILQK